MSVVKFEDKQWSWVEDNLFDFIYIHRNYPFAFADFFKLKEVAIEIKKISDYLVERTKKVNVFPEIDLTFKSLRMLSEPKVVILGLDPYPNMGSAVGLAFSLPVNSTLINVSMVNIQKEVEKCGFNVNKKSGNLINWMLQGVILLNTALTVEEGESESHLELWSDFTPLLIKYISEKYNLVWLLFGRSAHSYECLIEHKDTQCIIKTSHPSGLSANRPSGGNPAFIGSKVFSETNKWLSDNHKKNIDWSIN